MLTVSRPDIATEEIQEFPVDTRFIKLPIANYLKLLPAKDPDTGGNSNAWEQTNNAQIALINAINNPNYRFVCAALARRLGKTYIANIIAQLIVLIPGSNVLIVSPNFSLSTISFEIQRSLIKAFDLETDRMNLKDKVLELTNGSSVRMGSVGTIDSNLGRSYSLILFDEAAIAAAGKDAFNIALRPTLDKPNSKAIFISTPRGKNNWFSEFFDRGFSSEFPQWASIHADWTENHRMRQSDVDEARKAMSKAEFEQEYEASFATFEGQIYTAFNSEKHAKEFERTDGLDFIAGLDPGYKDPTAFIVLAYDQTKDVFHVVAEYLKNEAVTSEHAVAFQSLIDQYGVEVIFIDSAAAQFASDLAYTYEIATIKANKNVLPGISYVQNILERDRLLVDPSCVHTIAMLDQYRWKPDTGNSNKETPLHDVHSHMADALRYALYSYTL